MLKYVDTKVVMSEIPDEIALAINISNCPCKCEGCHSDYLAEDIGTELTNEALAELIRINDGITCVAFMGGDAEPLSVYQLALFMKERFPHLKRALYSGREYTAQEPYVVTVFDYLKCGPYISSRGPLTDKNTNQVMYRITTEVTEDNLQTYSLENITHLFWKEEEVKQDSQIKENVEEKNEQTPDKSIPENI